MHEHSHPQEVTPAALLAHMVEHNRSHLAELERLAGALGGQTEADVRAAAETIRRGNEQLAEALRRWEGQE